MDKIVFKDEAKIIKDLGWYLCDLDDEEQTKLNQFSNHFHEGYFRIRLNEENQHRPNDYYSNYFSFQSGSASYSCAVPNIGVFAGYTNKNLPKEAIAALLKIAILVNEKQGYIQAITLGKKDWSKLNDAFELTPFKRMAVMKTMHVGPKYDVIVWEWIKDVES